MDVSKAEKSLLAILIQLRNRGPINVQEGICHNVDEIASRQSLDGATWNAHDRVFSQVVAKWPRFQTPGASLAFPVPDPAGGSSCDAFYSDMPKWDREHPYGASRWDLLNFMIEYLEARA